MSDTIRIPLKCDCGNKDDMDIIAPPCSNDCGARMKLDIDPVLTLNINGKSYRVMPGDTISLQYRDNIMDIKILK
jgi:hypothetical protein